MRGQGRVEGIAPEGERAARGVFEDEYAFAGTHVLNLYNSAGTRIGRWEAVAGVTDEQFMDAMEALLARREPHRRLTLS